MYPTSQPDHNHRDVVIRSLDNGSLDKAQGDIVSLDFLFDNFLNRFYRHVIPQTVTCHNYISMMQPDWDALYLWL